MCQKVCPNNTIITKENSKRNIKADECIMCFKCEQACPVNAIKYKKD